MNRTTKGYLIYRLRIGERPQPVIIFLSSCVPQAQVDWAAIDLKQEQSYVDRFERFSEAHHNIGRIVVKHCRYVFTRKCIGSVANQKTGFTWKDILNYDFVGFLLFRVRTHQLHHPPPPHI